MILNSYRYLLFLVKCLWHSRRLEISEPLKAVEKPWATSKMAGIHLEKFS